MSTHPRNILVVTVTLCGLLLGLTLLLTTIPASAQDEATVIEQNFKKITPNDEIRLRAILADPLQKDTPRGELIKLLNNKIRASHLLGDAPVRVATLKEAINVLPDNAGYKNVLSWLMFEIGDTEQGNYWRSEAVSAEKENMYHRTLLLVNQANDFYIQGRTNDAVKKLKEATSLQSTLKPIQDWQKWDFQRNGARLSYVETRLESQAGNTDRALTKIANGITHARAAVKLYLASGRNDNGKIYHYDWLQHSLDLQLRIQIEARKLFEAELTAQELLRLIGETERPPSAQRYALAVVANLRFAQRDFSSAETLWRKSMDLSEKLKYPELNPQSNSDRKNIALSLFAQNHHKQALKIFEKLDDLAGENSELQLKVRYRFDRAIIYLKNKLYSRAAELFAGNAAASARQYGKNFSGRPHFFAAQSSGLHGVALWKIGTADSKAQAYPLLQAAVRDIMSPENVDYLENIGIRKELREMIFSTYIEAATQNNPADALAALGMADWLRGGVVQEALGDAAIRAAASNDALSNLVRQDQDARNEIKGLRNFLSGEAGGSASSLPEIAVKIRERIVLLEKSRSDVQINIKASFPEYEKLVRPLPPSTLAIQSQLKINEALIVLQPTDDAVYVWALPHSGGSTGGTFHRAALPSTDLGKLVKRLRTSLDVAGLPANRMPAFDHQASQELYAKLLAPVQSGFAGKTSLIVAAGGALGQIPFGVLQTNATNPSTSSGRTEAASWLIQQAAITHVPSVAAWLSMRALPHKTAEQAMLAWGDPLFNLGNVAQASAAKGSASEVRKVDLTRANAAADLEKEDPRSALKYVDIPALPETRDELLAIAKTLGADAAKDIILGSQATRESVLAANKNGSLAKRRVVAFATHGLMAGDLPNLTQPALAMAGTKDDANNVLAPLLTLEDVLTLKLNADWVVLSACNTAAADGKAEEALSGLARGFFYAGSRSLLVTHWAVDSESAVTLTTETFKHYQTNPTAPKAESLRQAMLKVMSEPKTAHPAYWAPYALVGDGSR